MIILIKILFFGLALFLSMLTIREIIVDLLEAVFNDEEFPSNSTIVIFVVTTILWTILYGLSFI